MNRVNEITKDCFNALIQLRAMGNDASVRPEHVHQRLRGYVDEMISRGKALKMAESDLADITYAVVAFADELAQRKPGAVCDFWNQRPLQLHYFGENIAGDGFFDKLNRILADPKRTEVLSVYHVTLQFGFEGRYAIRGGEIELDMVRRRVRDGLGRLLTPEPVSRRHLPLREALRSRRMDFLVLWLGLFALLFAFCFLIMLRVALNGMSQDLEDRGQQLLRRFAGVDVENQENI
ncbi:MAG: DotU family type IV/VI secretion system protein [Nannocystaceae bacterium]|nr:DotU family type IV/VI secretion system protein [Nannocystaceae bacterium]